MFSPNIALSTTKRVRICGHWIEFSFSKTSGKSSNLSSTIFFTAVYFQNIASFLSLIDNIHLKLISSFHDDYYTDPKNKLFLKKLVSYDYGPKILNFSHDQLLDVQKMYTDYNYMSNIITKLRPDHTYYKKIKHLSCDGVESDPDRFELFFTVDIEPLIVLQSSGALLYWYRNLHKHLSLGFLSKKLDDTEHISLSYCLLTTRVPKNKDKSICSCFCCEMTVCNG